MSLRPQLVVYIRACIHVFGRCLQMYQLPEDDDDIFDEVNTSKRLNTSRYTLHALCFLLVISCNALLFYRSIGGTDNEHSVSSTTMTIPLICTLTRVGTTTVINAPLTIHKI